MGQLKNNLNGPIIRHNGQKEVSMLHHKMQSSARNTSNMNKIQGKSINTLDGKK